MQAADAVRKAAGVQGQHGHAELRPPGIFVAAQFEEPVAIQPHLAGMSPQMALLTKVATGAVVYLGVLGVLFRTTVRNAMGALATR